MFVAAYLVEPNAKRAAIAAGYSERRAEVTGSELLKRPDILTALRVSNRKITDKAERTAADISRAAWSIIENGEEPASARVSALSLEARRFTEYSDKHDVNVDVTARIEALVAVAHLTPDQLAQMAQGAR